MGGVLGDTSAGVVLGVIIQWAVSKEDIIRWVVS